MFALFAATPAAAQQVQVPGGTIEGITENDILQFRGIPFAAPPLASLRWKAPAPVVSWQGVRYANATPPACLQNDYGWNRADHERSSEDCLTLDIGTQSLAGKRPVIVWIHGGSNRAGSAGGMSGSTMVARGVVMVAVQYRLGIFGFLPHRGAAAESGGSAGNYGLMDQIAALRWIKANIASFGGDPNNITIAGESAGSQDVGLMLLTPQARGLFKRAAMESGTPEFGIPPRPLSEALKLGDQLDALLGSGGDIAKLRAAPAEDLLAADLKLHDPVLTADDYMWLRATVDGAVLAEAPGALVAKAEPRDVLIGSNAFELGLPGGPDKRDAFLALSFGNKAAAARRVYQLDSPEPAADPRLGTRDQIIATDATFRCPAGSFAERMAARGGKLWRYEFDHAKNGGMTSHAAEIGYIFWNDRAGPLFLQDYWLNFARTGDPNGVGLPHWPRFTQREPANLLFDARGATPRLGLRDAICKLTERL